MHYLMMTQLFYLVVLLKNEQTFREYLTPLCAQKSFLSLCYVDTYCI